MRDFTRTLRNKFKSKRYFRRHPRMGYLPVAGGGSSSDAGSGTEGTPSPQLGPATPTPSETATPNTHTMPRDHGNSSNGNNALPPQEVHSRLEMYASRLAEVELRSQSSPITDSLVSLLYLFSPLWCRHWMIA